MVAPPPGAAEEEVDRGTSGTAGGTGRGEVEADAKAEASGTRPTTGFTRALCRFRGTGWIVGVGGRVLARRGRQRRGAKSSGRDGNGGGRK